MDIETNRTTLVGGLADAVPHLVWVADPTGVILEYSGRIADYDARRVAGRARWHWESFVHPDDLAAAEAAWRVALASRSEEHTSELSHG